MGGTGGGRGVSSGHHPRPAPARPRPVRRRGYARSASRTRPPSWRGDRTHGPDLTVGFDVPPRRDQADAHARGWPPGLRAARRCAAELAPPAVRVHDRGPPGVGAFPQAALPVLAYGRAVGLAGRRAARHRVPRSPLGAARAGPGPRAPRPGVSNARVAARPAAAPLGDERDRGARGPPVRVLHQGPPRHARRRLGPADPRTIALRGPGRRGPAALGRASLTAQLGRHEPAEPRRRPPGGAGAD